RIAASRPTTIASLVIRADVAAGSGVKRRSPAGGAISPASARPDKSSARCAAAKSRYIVPSAARGRAGEHLTMTALFRSLSARVLFALVAGLALGAAIQSSGAPLPALVEGVEAVGGLWLNALQMTVIPLVFSLLVTGIGAASDAVATGRL